MLFPQPTQNRHKIINQPLATRFNAPVKRYVRVMRDEGKHSRDADTTCYQNQTVCAQDCGCGVVGVGAVEESEQGCLSVEGLGEACGFADVERDSGCVCLWLGCATGLLAIRS